MTVQLTGYQILDQLYASSRVEIYKAKELANQKPVVVKLLKSEYPSFSELAQFRNQYNIAKNINLPEVIKTYNIIPYRKSYALIMEDFGGISLKTMIKKWGRMGESTEKLEDFFAIAIQIASALDGLYRHRIIHKDIKPANILINPSTKQVKLIDFSIASLLPKQTQTIISPNLLEGTLAYISPEQTGRMNRGVDYRSDFYSLGVTFYELLTGQLPFQSSDPMECIHCHLAKQPPSISSICPNVAPILCDLVDKLMAKNAEDRYQSALGLKHDLEICLVRLQNTGTIEPFRLGQEDLCDRFLIPEKLYGREAEVQILLQAFDRVAQQGSTIHSPATGKSELMLVAGFSGIGKTVVVNEVHKPIARQRGYFIKGKFDQFQRNIPFSAFVQALRNLMIQLLAQSDTQLQQWKINILKALGENAQVIIDVIPELESIVGQQPPVAKLSDHAAQNRFYLLFQKFIQIFSTNEHPLVVFLDDLQWADSASLKLMQVLMSETNTQHLLIIGAYRDNEVSGAHPLMLTLLEMQKAQITINAITLAPLTLTSLNQLVADTLNCSLELALPLTELVMTKTKGNPFFSTQFLKALYEDKLITFVRTDSNTSIFSYSHNIDKTISRRGYWQCDIAQIRATAITDNVVDFITQRIQKLLPTTQQVLKLAACIGNQFDLNTLSIVYEKSQGETAADLWQALQVGLVIPKSELYKFFQDSGNQAFYSLPVDHHSPVVYKFLHDRIQQAAYFLIPESEKKLTHLKIGQLLLYNIPKQEQQERIFEIVNQLNMGLEFITQPSEKNELASLNLIAGKKAKAATAYSSAIGYLRAGIQLLGSDSWQTQYDLTLSFYELAATAAYLSGNFDQMNHFVEVVLQKSNTLLDTIKVYEVQIESYAARHQLIEAINTGLKILKLLGVEFPEERTHANLMVELQKIKLAWEEKGLSELINLPSMTDSNKLAAMNILSSISAASYLGIPELYALVVLKQVELSLNYGNTYISAHGYATYGLILCGEVGDIKAGNQFGQLALQLLQKSNAKELEAKVGFIVNCFIRHWQEPLRNLLQPIQLAYTLGLETGDLSSTGYCAFKYCAYSYFAGKELPEVEQEITEFSGILSQLNQMTTFNYCAIHHQAFWNLMETCQNPTMLQGNFYDEEKMLPFHQQANDRNGIFYLYFNKLILSYLFEEYHLAIENAVLTENCLSAAKALPQVPIFYFYDSLVRLAIYKNVTQHEQYEILLKVNTNQKKMRSWADNAPENYLHKFYLVEAEQYRILEQKIEAIEMYDRAIGSAKENNFLHEEALANELAAKFYIEWGQKNLADNYMLEAYYCYSRWGAKAKVESLEKRYSELLTPILHPKSVMSETGFNSSFSMEQTLQTITTNDSLFKALDLGSLLKALQSLTSEIELSKLIATLMQVVLENSGAQKGSLVLLKGDRLLIEAIEEASNPEPSNILQSIPLEESDQIPVTVLNYVKRTGQTLVLNNAVSLPTFARDPYVLQNQPKSLLCTPLLHQAKLIGLLYLENKLTLDAFTNNRVELLHLLCSQAAISLEKAQLYQDLQESEAREREKATQLEQSLQQLQQAQLQLVQNEKMATLGNLVAGVAHEINNPVGFIESNIEYAQEYIQDILTHLELYKQRFGDPGKEIIAHAEQISLDFLQEDLLAVIASMKTGAERIANISTSLRTFSRSDTSHKVACDIHDGIDSTLLILKYRLKASDRHAAIEVVKDYGNLPLVECFPGQINQVFMNILANAIDAIDETMDNQSPIPTIHIRTKELPNNQVAILIKDNGPGMSEDVKSRIFDHLFTTKSVGKGTGLGLSIARQIVEEIHQGQISCISTLGEGTEFIIHLPVQISEE
ncbi:trifunctional serine/threonine-protein kinase/ATP-binding protein/sensor histidine kinase [Aetokthonos hydrillicola Thurmond2011]|uniref:histidine kinase n=2 Tax=Aetokthonos TaxID=1550243 RepID=A0AAP5M8F1_9CYAN|nr:AAA family ATPase [Aetokthonos hydrillicola]MDR9893209.1 trifunctional serine/threonine-protein kinase/ATP-binding protein/sensor histidine kinase [Aetokthonos hydrillicola Thurmond2011]